MATTDAASAAPDTNEDFAALLNESLGEDGGFEGRVLRGIVISVDGDHYIAIPFSFRQAPILNRLTAAAARIFR